MSLTLTVTICTFICNSVMGGQSAKFEGRNEGAYFFGVKIVNAGTCEGKMDITGTE